MRSFFYPAVVAALVGLVGLAGCSSGPSSEVAKAYNNQYGAVKTSLFTACPKIEGVWHLGNLTAGSLQLEDGQLIQHFRWFAPYLFGLSVNAKSFIAVEPKQLETVVYLADKIPGAGSRSAVSYTMLDEAKMPCIGHGWRRVATHNHSTNDAAARVLNLIPEESPKIIQTDYLARTANHELVLAIRIDYSGADKKDNDKKINDGYWHFVKMPRLHEDPKAQGFKAGG
jgi:hypothetical protein